MFFISALYCSLVWAEQEGQARKNQGRHKPADCFLGGLCFFPLRVIIRSAVSVMTWCICPNPFQDPAMQPLASPVVLSKSWRSRLLGCHAVCLEVPHFCAALGAVWYGVALKYEKMPFPGRKAKNPQYCQCICVLKSRVRICHPLNPFYFSSHFWNLSFY